MYLPRGSVSGHAAVSSPDDASPDYMTQWARFLSSPFAGLVIAVVGMVIIMGAMELTGANRGVTVVPRSRVSGAASRASPVPGMSDQPAPSSVREFR